MISREHKARSDRFLASSASARSGASGSGQSVKASLLQLHSDLAALTEEADKHKAEVEMLREEKERLEADHDIRAKHVWDELQTCCQKIESDMKKSFAEAKAEKAQLQSQLTGLKGEKTMLQQQLLALQRRIAELEIQVGCSEDF